MIKVGLIGCGYWGKNLLRVLKNLERCELVACCDIDEEKLDEAQKKWKVQRTTTDYNDIIRDVTIDAVVIATPTNSHYEIAKNALLHNKHVFVEKPFVREYEQGIELLELQRAVGKVLMVGHTFLYSPAVRKIKEILKNKELGEVFYISSRRVNLGIHRKDVNVVWDLASHDLSILFYWLERTPYFILATGKDCVIDGKPDVAFITLRFPEEVICNIEVSWLAPSKIRNITIVGSDKMLVYDDTEVHEKIKIFNKSVEVLNHDNFGEFQLAYRTGEVIAPYIPNDEPLKVELSHFIDCIIGKKEPLSNAESGLEVVKYLELIEKSLQLNGKPIDYNEDTFRKGKKNN